MNLADYLSELLGQYEEVSVPGLGYFKRRRVNGYYSDNEAKFYPPHHTVTFVEQPKDDDVFAQYVADKKNISLASSKYFTEKFVGKLREDALTGRYQLAGIGVFYTEHDQLVFEPADKINTDPAFYGYPEVSISKIGKRDAIAEPEPPAATATAPVAEPVVEPFPEPVAEPLVVQPVAAAPDEPYFEEENQRKRISIWLVLLIIAVGAALTLFTIYQFYPATFNQLKVTYKGYTGQKDPIPLAKPKMPVDTSKKSPPVADTITKAAPGATPALTAKQTGWQIIDFSVRYLSTANAEAARLKAKGVDAKVITDTLYRLLRVSAGAFPTKTAADSAMQVMIKEGKIRKKSKTLEIKP
ncbi:MAG: HU domain-containing protein [Mucilaginibacter sp.]